ncbi:molybdenum cofactor guanylyltransferase [Arthrobacter sp. SLBN-112]|uniref:molybdenum cofactor guanylyltransferase n=1 Tax=Arthrobacter sp. SLBN-112 TaxID=2768452 RepID=UPI001F3C61DE|nr:NTP transferase domain-containing protein [Arthrobacter sp. SLBN-112]
MEVNSLAFDAVVLAGGRSSRLGGTPKQSLVFQGQTLLERAVAAAAGAGLTVVVGDTDFVPHRPSAAQPLPAWPADLLTCREEPRFAGPAAAIAAGLEVLAAHHAGTGNGGGAPYTLVLACDMPLASQAVAALLDALVPSMEGTSGGVMACAEDGRAQPLAGFYRTSELTKACKALAARDALVNGSVRALLASLDVQLVTVPAGSTADVDTWGDVAALGIAAVNQREGQDRHSGGVNVGGNS